MHEEGMVLLLAVAKKHSSFVPQHQFLLGLIGHGKVRELTKNIIHSTFIILSNYTYIYM